MAKTSRSELSTDRRGACCDAPPIRAGTPRMPHVMTLELANGYRLMLAVYDSGPQNGDTVPPGVVDFNGTRTTAAEMRRHILERHYNNNYFVGFHLAWTLTA